MSSALQNSGVSMMMRALGIDPQVLTAKAIELEQLAKAMAADLAVKVAAMEQRISHMEQMMEQLQQLAIAQTGAISRLESSAAGTAPAGETAAAGEG